MSIFGNNILEARRGEFFQRIQNQVGRFFDFPLCAFIGADGEDVPPFAEIGGDDDFACARPPRR